ncbi:hypothetical protein WJ97_12145 [Burkholderia ubonensis]|uniref:hypothetical protein n=1 Tax=Burkholderia ubonensis TaxID=101571 RepID=UPI00075BAFD6|nr:hypothetical protein [Burkholderia ubonensis]KVP96628.1 hypothetical protein WJ97_12145 [Burkholderia ubonensis]
MHVRTIIRSAVALAIGLAALSAHAAPAADASKQLIRMTSVEVYGHIIMLAKYLSNGQVCQQYVKEAGSTTSPDRYQWDVKLGEICGRPELRIVDGESELFPAKLVDWNTARFGGGSVGVPMFGVMHVSTDDEPVQP